VHTKDSIKDINHHEEFHSLSFRPISRSSWQGTGTATKTFNYHGKGPHVYLLNPYIPNHSQNPKINSIVNITFPTSIGFVAAYLRQNGVDRVDILDEQLYPLSDKDLEALIKSMSRPAIIGISSLTLNASRAYQLAEKIKKIDPSVITVIGGIHPTVLPKEPFDIGNIDYAIRGEGEIPMLELVKGILSGKTDFGDINGLTYMENGSVINTPPTKLVQNLDDIPVFPYEMFEGDLHKYPGFAGVFGSRGCPYFCTFCSARSMSGLKYRYHSVERLTHEFKVLIRKYKQESVFLMDDNIGVHKTHFKETCAGIVKEGLHKEAFFHGSMRGDNATDDILDAAVEANFKILYFGLETGVEKLMKQIDKGESVAQVADAIHRASARGISVGTTIIYGLPNETQKDRKDTLKFVKKLPIISCRFNTLTPYPGTQDYVTAQSQNRLLVKGRWENFGVQYMWEGDEIPYVPPGESRLQLMFDTMFANLSYYLSFSGIIKIFTARYAGGNVIKLERYWYIKPREIKKFWDVGTLISGRFISVTARLGVEKIKMLLGIKYEDELLPTYEAACEPGAVPAFDRYDKMVEIREKRKAKREREVSAAELAKYV